MIVPFLDMRSMLAPDDQLIREALWRVVDRGVFILGEEVTAFEKEFRDYLFPKGEGEVVAVNSGTDAIKLSLLAAGIGPGDEVITVPNTAIPTAAAICSVGAVPVFCDIDAQTWTLDPESLRDCLSSRTRAVVPVHLYGTPCVMDAIECFAREHGLIIVEDVAQAAGAWWDGRACGTLGNFGAFSFYPTKNLGALGDAGAIAVRDPGLAEKLRWLRNYGQSDRYHAQLHRGENSRMDEMQAAVLRVRLKRLEQILRDRRKRAKLYRTLLSEFAPVSLQQHPAASRVAPHLFVIAIDSVVKGRDEVVAQLASKGVQALIHYPLPLTHQPAFAGSKCHCPVAEKVCNSILSLPFYETIPEHHIEYVVECIREVL